MNIRRCSINLWPGAESMGYELTSDAVSITIADLGAHLSSVLLRVDGSDELEVSVQYPADSSGGKGFHGASVGRYANRIAGSRFRLDDVEYQLDSNEGPNQLHGGPEGFSSFAWSADAETDADTGRVVLRHTSKALDQGFPGKVQATAIYELTDNQLTISYRAKVSDPTPINLTNHAYWNLAGGGSLDDHELTVAAPAYVDVDESNIPLPGPPVAVEGSRFDCRSPRSLASVVADGGYDHCFVLDPEATTHALLRHVSGRAIDIVTNQVGLQVYTGQLLNPDARGIALETQCLPDTPNRPDFGDATVRPGDKYLATTTFTFLV